MVTNGELEERVRQLEGEVAKYQVLLKAAKAVNSTLDLRTTLTQLEAFVLNNIGQVVTICLVDENEGKLKAAIIGGKDISSELSKRVKEGYQPNLSDEGVGPSVVRTGKPLYVKYPAIDKKTNKKHVKIYEDAGIRGSYIIVPIKMGENVLGTLSVHYKNPDIDYSSDMHVIEGVAGLAAIAIDNARTHEKVRELAEIDTLSGLHTRSYYERELLKRAIENANRFGKGILGVTFADIDGLKDINDKYGHSKGDDMIRRAGGIVKKVTRKVDFAVRYGGDELLILSPGFDETDSISLISRLQEEVDKQNSSIADSGLHLKFSIGFACGRKDYEEVVKRADQQMYAQKHGKK